MKRNWILILLALIVLSSCKRAPAPLTEAEVLNVINMFDSGWDHKNLHIVDAVLSPSYVYFTQSGSLFNRDSVVATAGEDSYKLSDMSRTELTVTLDGNTAIVSSRWKGKGYYRGTPFNEDQRCSLVIIKQDGKVEILSEHCTPIKTSRIFH